ncbi:MAG TPA: HpcH/HpaI aldolase/citrate lyase family protein [Gammaproteobacteria bacterium]|nr:HpcH/HpaI aldolase/citrate lyase family protein [Gammaproteobacteria bacterium]
MTTSDVDKGYVRSFRRALQGEEQLIGLWSGLCSNMVTEILADAGFDWIVLDNEHAPNGVAGTLSQLQAMKGGTAAPVVRVPWNDPVLIKRYLDIGAETLLVPLVDTPEQARAAVRATRYPSTGVRGAAGGHRASRYGRDRDYLRTANERVGLIVQVETATAVSNLPEIARVDGVDGVFIGPSDLSASMGFLGQPRHPEVRGKMAEALAICQDIGMPAGTLAPDMAIAQEHLEAGFKFVATGSDIIVLVRGTDELVAGLKGAART